MSTSSSGLLPTPVPSPTPPPQRRTRSERVAFRNVSQGFLARCAETVRRDHLGLLFLITCLATLAICFVLQAWDPPFEFHVNDPVTREIVCNTAFSIESPDAKRIAEERARWYAPHVFVNDPEPLVQLRESLWITIGTLLAAGRYDQLDEAGKQTWNLFLHQRTNPPTSQLANGTETVDPKTAFETFISHFQGEKSLGLFNSRLKAAFTEFEIHGLLSAWNIGPSQGNQETVRVYLKGKSADTAVSFRVAEVLMSDGSRLKANLLRDLPREMQNTAFVDHLFNWLYPQLKDTLREDKSATEAVRTQAVAAVGKQYDDFVPGQVLVEAGDNLQQRDVDLLRAEHRAAMNLRDPARRILRFHAVFFSILTLLSISWVVVRRFERRRPKTPKAFLSLMAGLVLTVLLAKILEGYTITGIDWFILSILLFVMIVSIMYSCELAIVYAALVALILALGTGSGIDFLVVLLTVSVTAGLQLGRLRSRRKLVVVSVVAGMVAAVLTLALGLFDGLHWETPLILNAGINLLAACMAGLIMTGLLPFLEEPFGILSDMSLLELGDVSHPLLQTMTRLAPATYGHSMQVATIAETAAESIGARGLLTRVGAYFHDIGKIMKPEYYSENQTGGQNIHDTLQPQVSTIVVIAHVKDGSDLARQHHLPQPLIDLIEQHHGTTLVSFFYGRAASNAGKDDSPVEESTFRYPGPKPQSKEAAILMIADSCESACRSMGAAATPGKIENKVRVIIKQKLDDGQFDESGLTLLELKTIENSVIKSVIAAMHGRIKYPGQEAEEAAKTGILLPTTRRDESLQRTK